MSLPLTLATGALRSPFKRLPPTPAALSHTARLHRPAVRPDPHRLHTYNHLCGYGTAETIPLPYPHLLGFPLAMRLMAAPAFPLPLLGLVHTRITLTRHHPLTPDAPLDLTVHVTGLSPHHRGTEATVTTEAHSPDGTLLWDSTSAYLARHPTPDQDQERTDRSAPAPLPALAEWRLPPDLGRRYGAVSGDRNPIHLHPLTARPFGFRRPIAHGMYTLARCLSQQQLPDAVRVEATFTAPVPLPATAVYAADNQAFELRAPDGRAHLRGTVTIP
ncbi:MaoC family dehydratase [Streptomyces lichenis]|uniref:MaoC-like domain-containing protein n=1 Tax=Streptomyces lichenis TaxID=2306967 RepID=A0ABT0IIN9_9ACTN|nr:MaoC/PaaZ C-terminal domain-containing protein [Streptomyces lichenis]MCK8681183.1 hypothetical protein [Streptomyces lichenis]